MSHRLPSTESPPSALLPSRAALASLLDGVEEPLLLFDDLGTLSFCNHTAMRALGAMPGNSMAQLQAALGTQGVEFLRDCLQTPGGGLRQCRVELADGRAA
jgi:hypothetical protein